MSYYDFYRPESYRPTADVYLKKTSAVNDDIDTLRHATTQSLLSRRDVVVVASVSCLYGLGVPDEYRNAVTTLRVGEAYIISRISRRRSRHSATRRAARAAAPTRCSTWPMAAPSSR